MPRVRVSVETEKDIDEIAEYTASTWGWWQASQYLFKLEDGFDRLARTPSIGRPCDPLRAGLRRSEIERHVVFYLPEPDGVLVARVLHRRMLPDNYL